MKYRLNDFPVYGVTSDFPLASIGFLPIITLQCIQNEIEAVCGEINQRGLIQQSITQNTLLLPQSCWRKHPKACRVVHQHLKLKPFGILAPIDSVFSVMRLCTEIG